MNCDFKKWTRFYRLEITHDLFGWVVVKHYGRKGTPKGRIQSLPFSTYHEAYDYYQAEIRRRLKRNYFQVSATP